MLGIARKVVFKYQGDIQDFQKRSAPLFERARELLKEEKTRENSLIEQSKQALEAFRISSVRTPNFFLKAGFSPNEDAWSDAIATILNPKRSGGLGLGPLQEILSILAKKSSEAAGILKILKSYKADIRVARNVHRGDTRPDIEIRGDGFLIYIENKTRFGSETIGDGGHLQTKRQQRDLALRSKREGLKVLGIFLSPMGMKPASNKFVSLAGHELAQAIRNAVDKIGDNYHGRNLLNAFMETFDFI